MSTPINTSILYQALTLALCAAAVGSAQAQATQEDSNARMLDAITVTGSRISVPGVEASSPVANVERNEFLATQPVAVESFLKDFPALTPSIGRGANYEPGGGATINMRGLGDNRTLVLVDGRRPIPFNLQSVVDTNTIPLSLLQSVEMLTGGASVVYGADAVAGVTNFILRRDFEGVELNMSWGQSVRYGDADREHYEMTFGALSDDGRANAVLSVGFSKADPVAHADRPWSRVALSSKTGDPTGTLTTVPALVNVVGANQGNRQMDPASGTLGDVTQLYNFAPLYLSQTGLERWQATGLARYEANRHAEAYAQVNYTRSQVESRQAPVGVFLQVLDVPLGNPFIPDGMRQQICNELGFSATECASGMIDPGNSYNPDIVGVDGSGRLITRLQTARRFVEKGARLNNYDTKTFQTTIGLRGDLNDHWRYDAYWSYGESDQLQAVINWAGLTKVQQAVNAVSTDVCLDPSGGCVPLNLFADEGSISQAQLDFVHMDAFAIQKVEQTNAGFNVDGDLGDFKSPLADYPIGISAGLEYRRMLAGLQPDAMYAKPNELLGLESSMLTFSGGFSISEAYLESILPLLNGYTGADNLSLELGYRHSEFSTTSNFDNQYGSWKYGLSWAPVDNIKLRAMRQRATRAPNVGELFTPGRTSVGNLGIDPCAQLGASAAADVNTQGTLAWLCNQTGVPGLNITNLPVPSVNQINIYLAGNPQLSPEQADTTTLGLVWTPTDRFSFTLDWWDIEVNDAISTPTPQDVIDGCYSTGLNPGRAVNQFCDMLERNPLTGTFSGAGSRGIGLPLSNQGFLHKSGIDLGLRFAHDLPGRLGRMQYALDLSKVNRDDFRATPISNLRDCLGYYGTNCRPSHDIRSNLRTNWNMQDLSVSLSWRYLSALDLDPVEVALNGPFLYNRLASTHYFDLGVTYRAPWNTTLSLSVNNLTGQRPRIHGYTVGNSRDSNGNTHPQWYDVLGRFITLGVSVRF